MVAVPDFAGRTCSSAMPLLFVRALTVLPPGSLIFTSVLAGTFVAVTLIVVSSPARTFRDFEVARVHAGWAALAPLTPPCGTGAGAGCGAGGAVRTTVQ